MMYEKLNNELYGYIVRRLTWETSEKFRPVMFEEDRRNYDLRDAL